MTEEHIIQNRIRAALSPYAVMFRVNVGKGYTPDGRYFDTGVPVGFSDLFGFRKCDGRAVFIEVKTPAGKPSREQLLFLRRMRESGAIADICRSVPDALRLIGADEDGT